MRNPVTHYIFTPTRKCKRFYKNERSTLICPKLPNVTLLGDAILNPSIDGITVFFLLLRAYCISVAVNLCPITTRAHCTSWGTPATQTLKIGAAQKPCCSIIPTFLVLKSFKLSNVLIKNALFCTTRAYAQDPKRNELKSLDCNAGCWGVYVDGQIISFWCKHLHVQWNKSVC